MQIKEYIISKYGVSIINSNINKIIIDRININHVNGYLFFRFIELIINNILIEKDKINNNLLPQLLNLSSIDFT